MSRLVSATVFSPMDAKRMVVAGFGPIRIDNALNAGEWYHEHKPDQINRMAGMTVTMLNGRGVQ